MIIDEILDKHHMPGLQLDHDYIKDEASLFGFDYITKAYEEAETSGNYAAVKNALAKYIRQQGYSENIIDYLDELTY